MSALAVISSGVTRTSANSRSSRSRATRFIVLVTSTVWKTVTCGAVNALATIASAVRLRTDFTGTRVSRPSSETLPDGSHGASSPG